MFSQLDLFFSTTPLAGPEQMALDEVLLRTVEKPLLRIYRWKEPCVTFGYFQKLMEVRKKFPEQTLVRRWTGGGIVEHSHDVTFSLIVPARTPSGEMAPSLFYETLHKAMTSALQAHQIMARLATCDDVAKGEACFAAPALHDLLLEHKKILGGAQRRSAGSLLYQGSLLLPKKPDTKLAENIFHSLASILSPAVTTIEAAPAWLEQATELAASRYGSASWLERR